MPGVNRVSASQIVEAKPAEIYRIVTDPSMHVKIDGSGMLQATPNAKRLVAVGDTFEMDMDRTPLGDVPLGRYKVLNTVTKIVPDAAIEWNVRAIGRDPSGNVYGWEITPVDEISTKVTNYSDWSAVSDERKERFPVVPVEMLAKSVENIAKLLAQDSQNRDGSSGRRKNATTSSEESGTPKI